MLNGFQDNLCKCTNRLRKPGDRIIYHLFTFDNLNAIDYLIVGFDIAIITRHSMMWQII